MYLSFKKWIKKILNKRVINENSNVSNEKSILVRSAIPRNNTNDSQKKRSILVQSSMIKNEKQKPKVRVLTKNKNSIK